MSLSFRWLLKLHEKAASIFYQLVFACVTLTVVPSVIAATPSNATGWTHLDEEMVDVGVSAFHDKISGAFIRLEVGIPGVISALAPRIAASQHVPVSSGKTDGLRYAMVLVEEKREKFIRAGCPGSISESSAQALIVSYDTDDKLFSVWNFTALICNSDQLQRVKDFLINGQTWRNSTAPVKRRTIRPEDLKMISPGMNWQKVREVLGPSLGPAGSKGGFVVSFYYDADNKAEHDELVWLLFSQNQELTSVAFKDPDIPIYSEPH